MISCHSTVSMIIANLSKVTWLFYYNRSMSWIYVHVVLKYSYSHGNSRHGWLGNVCHKERNGGVVLCSGFYEPGRGNGGEGEGEGGSSCHEPMSRLYPAHLVYKLLSTSSCPLVTHIWQCEHEYLGQVEWRGWGWEVWGWSENTQDTMWGGIWKNVEWY